MRVWWDYGNLGIKKPLGVRGYKRQERILMLKNLLKATVGTVLLPVGVAIDLVTLPALMVDDRDSSTAKIGKAIIRNVERAVQDKKDS